MSLQRRRELARLTKTDLVGMVISLEFASMNADDAAAALGLSFECQEFPDTQIAPVSEVE